MSKIGYLDFYFQTEDIDILVACPIDNSEALKRRKGDKGSFLLYNTDQLLKVKTIHYL